MSDTLLPAQRRKCMAAIRGKNTKPELIVRRIAHRLGFRFRLHASDLPGKPDLVFRSRRAVIFVHGCFWHLHSCRKGSIAPINNASFWEMKRRSNSDRDKRTLKMLRRGGWKAMTIWECQTRDIAKLAARISTFLEGV